MSKRCMGCMELYSDEFGICPHCGYIDGTPVAEAIHMEPGSVLDDRYIVGRVLGFGGFGVTYIGWDSKLEQKVAIKEYLPGEFSTRMPGRSAVTVFNGDKSQQFYDGMKKFVEEAKRLAKFHNEPGIVKVFDSFTENETAYIVMEYLDGETLTERLKREKTIPEDEAVTMLLPVMESLKTVHEEGILHRDIAPDNIFLTKSGEVKLIDFGASRYATTSYSRSLTVIIKPGYSPEEQYRSRGDQGPHTDVYALAATLYKMVTGQTPPDAMERHAKIEMQKKELLEEPHKLNKSISENVENAVLNAMNVRIQDRTPDIQTFINELLSATPVKRRYGKIKKIDLYHWPLWLKILIPAVLAVLITVGILLATGVIKFPSLFSDKIVIPEGIVVVPDVEGMDKDEALKIITESKLIPTSEGSVESEFVEAGKILLQSPTGGAYAEENGKVVLTVSSGKGVQAAEDGISTVPYVVWDTQERAIEKLKQAGLAEPLIETRSDETVPAGQVIAQSVAAGEKLAENTQITLTVSTGPAPFDMPVVTGQTEDAARKTLEGKGLRVAVEYKKDDEVPEGSVISQSVAPGSTVKRGDEVLLTVCSRKKTATVANVTGKTKDEAIAALKAQGFKTTVLEQYDPSVAAGCVISQTPGAGTSQIEGSTITLYVSKGKQPGTTAKPTEPPTAKPTTMPTAKPTATPKPVAKPIASGTCGTNLTWSLDDNGKLTVSGTGSMINYPSDSSIPWYSYRSQIKTVEIGQGVTSIGGDAFSDCDSLTSITIPNSVTGIGGAAFSHCTSLTSITIPNSVTSIGAGTFNGCTSLTSITIPNSVTSIENGTFFCCPSLTSITIPNSVTGIGNHAFTGCESLTSITLPNSVTSIGDNAFWYCTSLTSITIPNSVTGIGHTAFNGCTSLTSITIPNSVTSIGYDAFSGCPSGCVIYCAAASEPAGWNDNWNSDFNGTVQWGVTK